MVFRPTMANPAQKRTIRPLYAQHQATTWGGFLDPDWDRSFDIVPGTVMVRLKGDVFTPYTGAGGQKPFGLSALFCAPLMGIDEVTGTGTNLFTVWVGEAQAEFEVVAPGFDPTANWAAANPQTGKRQLLTATSQGLLTPTGVNASNAIAELVDVESTDKIVVRLNRFDSGPTAPIGGS